MNKFQVYTFLYYSIFLAIFAIQTLYLARFAQIAILWKKAPGHENQSVLKAFWAWDAKSTDPESNKPSRLFLRLDIAKILLGFSLFLWANVRIADVVLAYARESTMDEWALAEHLTIWGGIVLVSWCAAPLYRLVKIAANLREIPPAPIKL